MNQRRDPHTILVVDDDAGIRDTLGDLLADEGYAVLTAAHGLDALTKLRQNGQQKPCVILLDLMMPVMTGAEFYTEQQRDPELASIPVVIISAGAGLPTKAAAFGGAYLAKPLRLETVLETVERYCP
jgi:CheY-like chemotaxis protein